MTGKAERALEAANGLRSTLAFSAEVHDRRGTYAAESIEALWAAGLGNLTLPVGLGGLGEDLPGIARVIEEVGTADPATALILVMHLVQLRSASSAWSRWPEHLSRRLINTSLAGPALANALRVEPDLGSPARGGLPATTARRARGADGSATWRLSGHKIYSTGSEGLRWMVVWAATEPDDPGGQRVGSFLVPATTAGVTIDHTWDHLGMRASSSHDVILDDVEIPFDHAIELSEPAASTGDADQAAWAAVLISSIYLGVAAAGRDWLVGYLHDRTPSNLGAPLSSLPRFQTTVGEIDALISDAGTLVDDLARALAAGVEGSSGRAGRVKTTVSRNVIRALDLGLALIGNPGLSLHHPLQRHYRNALCSRIHTPQDDAVYQAMGRVLLDQRPA